MELFTDDVRRNPYPLYEQIRSRSPLMHDPGSGIWLVFDFEGVKRVLNDTENFSSRFGPDWLIFNDPPRHSKLRALVSRAFTPKSVANLEPRIAELSAGLLKENVERGKMDLALDFAVPLPIMVIAEMLGIPLSDREQFKSWVDVILMMSYTIGRHDDQALQAVNRFNECTREMRAYLNHLLDQRRQSPKDDLLTRLDQAEIDGQRLTRDEILGFFQLLLLGGSETTTNLINNAILCFIEHPAELARLRADMSLLPSAIEEVLRYRAPFQWMYRIAKQDVELHGQTIPRGKMVLAVIGSANHDAKQFADPERFDISRDPNPHIAFGLGMHFCMGTPLARLESRIALGQILSQCEDLALADAKPWTPRQGLHVHGPASLPIRFRPVGQTQAVPV